MKSGQIKTLSFLTYMVKDYSPLLQQHQARICEAVVDLLRTCPDVPASRRELIAATRHIVASPELRTSFFPHLDALLDRDVLIVRAAAASSRTPCRVCFTDGSSVKFRASFVLQNAADLVCGSSFARRARAARAGRRRGRTRTTCWCVSYPRTRLSCGAAEAKKPPHPEKLASLPFHFGTLFRRR